MLEPVSIKKSLDVEGEGGRKEVEKEGEQIDIKNGCWITRVGERRRGVERSDREESEKGFK